MEFRCNPYALLFFGVTVIAVFSSLMSHGQCSQRIEVSNIVTSKEDLNVKFDVKVIALTAYDGQVYRIEGTSEVLIRTFSGSGERIFTFVDAELSKDGFYRIVIEYAEEKEFLCKRRVKDIVVTDTP